MGKKVFSKGHQQTLKIGSEKPVNQVSPSPKAMKYKEETETNKMIMASAKGSLVFYLKPVMPK